MPHKTFQSRLHMGGVYNTHSISVVGAIKCPKSGTLNFLYGQERLEWWGSHSLLKLDDEKVVQILLLFWQTMYMNNIVSTPKYKEKNE